jgi:hypothetical protein
VGGPVHAGRPITPLERDVPHLCSFAEDRTDNGGASLPSDQSSQIQNLGAPEAIGDQLFSGGPQGRHEHHDWLNGEPRRHLCHAAKMTSRKFWDPGPGGRTDPEDQ